MAEPLEFAYLYARVCGAFSKMRLGDTARELMRNAGGMVALWKQLFGEEAPNLPEAKLVFEAERRVIARSIDAFLRLAKPFSESSELIHTLISKYEISVIKSMLFRLRAGEPKPEQTSYSSHVIEQALDAWPRIEDMFRRTPYAWLSAQSLDNLAIAENRLDQQYYLSLWTSASAIDSRKVGTILDLIRWEIVYQNVVWALRVRRYYGLTRQDAAGMLVELERVNTTSLALQTFQYDIEKIDSFDPWPLKRLLSGQSGPALDVPILEIRTQ